MDTIKISVKIRYRLMLFLIKKITPNLYSKIEVCYITGLIGLSKFPRPAIKFIKKEFGNRFLKGAEIGVFEGNHAKNILRNLNIEKLYLVDSWDNSWSTHKIYESVQKTFLKNRKVKIIKKVSEKAINDIKDNSLDFVYIDADHTYAYVYQDISLWTNKVKEGGVLAGHDIKKAPDVLKAVKDYCLENKFEFEIDEPDWYFIKESD